MLNSTVAMNLPVVTRLLFLIAALVLSVALVGVAAGEAQAPTQASPTPGVAAPGAHSITWPAGGAALQGVVAVQGRTAVLGFQFAEVAFAYRSDPTNTWFLIQQSGTAVEDGLLANWDTSTITDGDYRLRLQVFLKDGQVLEMFVDGLRVRNYSPVETSTPAPAGESIITSQSSPAAPLLPSQTPLSDFQVIARTPTLLPTNPAVLSTERLQRSAVQGIGFVIFALLAGGMYAGLRRLFRR
jgi:hypothetical protein